ncbi:MAG: response regulator [Desulfobacterales bacterium]|nr:response regulator [Desulfobacterales bacterium]
MNGMIMTANRSRSVRRMVSSTLKQAGYDVLEVESGHDALDKAGGEPVNMVFTDINTSNMDGIELIRRLRSKRGCRLIPIIMMTTESQAPRRREGRAAGATGWIVTPFEPEQLLAVTRKVLGA